MHASEDDMVMDGTRMCLLLLPPHAYIFSPPPLLFFKGIVGLLDKGIHMICSAAISPFSSVIGSAEII